MTIAHHTINSMTGLLKAKPGSKEYPQKILWLILLLGLLCRIYIAFFAPLPNIHTDSKDYFSQADTLLQGGYTNFFPNGYPFIVALVKLIAGSAAISTLLWINIAMSVCNIYFVFCIASSVFKNHRVALLAAGIIAFFPSQVNYVRWLMTEVPAAFFLVGGYHFYFRKNYWLCGIFLGLATLVRTEFLPVLVLLFLADALFVKRVNLRLLMGGLLPLLLVGSYCYLKTGEFALAGHSRFNTLTSVTASGNHIDFYFANKHPEYNTNAKAVQLYLDTLKKAPVAYIKSRAANLWELWGFYAAATPSGRMLITRIIIGLGNFFLIVFGLPAFWRHRKEYKVLILIIPFVIVTLVHIVYFAMQRYTYPVEPFMIVLAACSVYALSHKTLRPDEALANGNV
ncbi:MAG TPA: hypothetical protein VL307_13925 [Chitinophagaceae bacterium]|nr:hypothetical protein [Chitinophagaceae bacterium]